MEMTFNALLLAFPAAMAFAAAMDLLTMTIPNRISLGLLALFGLVAATSGLPFHTIAMHVTAGALMLGIGIGMFAMGWVGGGDAKLLAAGALWLGFEQLPAFLLITGVVGSFLMLAIVCFRAYPAAALPIPEWALRLHRSHVGLPYGIAIGAAGLLVFPYSPLFRALS